MKDFIDEILWELSHLTQKQVYRLFCSMNQRIKQFWDFWMWKRDGIRFWLSERQMQKFINLMIDYGFLKIKRRVRSNRGFLCRLFSASEELLKYFWEIRNFVLKKFKYINPKEYMLARFPVIRDRYWKLEFRVNGQKYFVNKRWRFKDKIYWEIENRIINPLVLI